MSNKYEKHQKSRFKKWVATLPDGTKVQADTQAKLNVEIAKVDQQVNSSEKSVTIKPLYDPNTGERIN